MPAELTLAFVVVVASVVSALAALLLMGAFRGAGQRRDTDLFGVSGEDTVFLFDDEDLVDATDSARALLAASPVEGSSWARLNAHLAPIFPGLATELARLAEQGSVRLKAQGARPLLLRADWRAGLARIALVDPEAEGVRMSVDRMSHRALEEELAALRGIMDSAPMPVWREAADGGGVVWANRSYLDLAVSRRADQEALTWPLPRLFDDDIPPTGPGSGTAATRADPAGAPQRRRLALPGRDAQWFEHIAFPGADGVLHFALPADAAVRAETALRRFVQTLTKTFAHLPTGLAIFDRDRQLTLFNPALTDLTALGVDFLSARPTLTAFFDQLRERRMIPEPKDYQSWRRQISDLEKAASSGQYQETWTLPTGQTYRVTGRPHPDGAVAFLIDDISAETALTRRFRSDLETGQAVVDALDEAIAVFSPGGVMVMSNAAYARLWGVDPAETLGEVGIIDALRHWQEMAGDPALWLRARDFIAAPADRSAWQAAADLGDGRRIDCRFQPLSGGATMIRFREAGPVSTRKPRALPGKRKPGLREVV